MKMRRIMLMVMFLSAVILGTGYADGPKTYPGLESSSQLKPQSGDSDTLMYKREHVDGKKYIKFRFDPIEIYKGKDADFGGAAGEDVASIMNFMEGEFKRVLKGKYEIVDKSGPDVLRVSLTLAGIQLTKPVLAVVSRIIPVGLALNIGKSAAGMSGSFTGSLTMSGEFYDSETNTLLYAFLAKRSPNAMDVTAVLTGLDAAKKVVTEIAEKFVETIDRVQGKVKQ